MKQLFFCCFIFLTMAWFYFLSFSRKLVQGEAMGKNKLYKKANLPMYTLFTVGLILGGVIPNILWKIQWHQKTVTFMYLLGTFVGKSKGDLEYMAEVMQIRCGYFLIYAFGGCTFFGVPLAVLGTVFFGAEIGLLLTLSVLQFGFQGGIVGLGLLFPQYLIYVPCLFFLFQRVYRQSMEIWRGHGLYPVGMKRYIAHIFVCAVLYLIGIFLEFYCNPIITEMLIKSLEIF